MIHETNSPEFNAAVRAYPHGLTWDEWWSQTTVRDPDFRLFARRHFSFGNPPAWAEHLWRSRDPNQPAEELRPYGRGDKGKLLERVYALGRR